MSVAWFKGDGGGISIGAPAAISGNTVCVLSPDMNSTTDA